MTSYTNTFTAASVYTGKESYRALVLAQSTALEWGDDLTASDNIAAEIMDVSATLPAITINLPDASLVAPGRSLLITNNGGNDFTLADFTGGSIAVIQVGQSFHLYLRSNATQAGTWTALQFGSQASSAAASQLAGAGLKATGSQLAQSLPVTSFTTAYSASAADRGAALVWAGGSGTLTLPSAGSVGADWFAHVKNAGSGVLTVAASSNIDGSASLALNPNESFIVFTDGSTFYTVGKGVASTTTFTYTTINAAGTGDYTLSSIEQGKTAYKITGALTGNRNIVVPTTLASYWVDNETTGAFTLTVKTAAGTGVAILPGQRKIVYSDGTNVVDAATAGVAVPIAIADGGTGATTASAARTNLGATSVGNALFTASTAASARTALGSSTVGDAVFTAADAATARTALGLSVVSTYSVGTTAGTVAAGNDSRFLNTATVYTWTAQQIHDLATDGNPQFSLRTGGTQRASWAASSGYSFAAINGSGTTVFSVDQSGNGTFAAGVNSGAAVSASSASQSGVFNCSADNPAQIQFKTGGTARGTIGGNSTYPFYAANASGTAILYSDTAGNVTAAQNVTGYSDARLKTDVETIRDALGLIEKMRGVRYTRIDSGARRVGVIAQETALAVPEAVQQNPDGMLSVAYMDLVGVLVQGINELQERVRELELEVL